MKDYVLKKYNIRTDVIEIPNATRDDLAALAHELDLKVGVEVGVAAGQYSYTLAKANPQMKLYGVDPYIGYDGYRDYTRKSTFDGLMENAHKLLDPFPNYEFIRKPSVEASKDFGDGSLDFVYIDANHAEPYVSQDINAWAPKVRKGGIVAGHDYARIKGKNGEPHTNWAVIQAIQKYVKDNNKELFVWGLEAKLPGLKRDAARSWMFFQ